MSAPLPPLTLDEQTMLLSLARRSVVAHLNDQPSPPLGDVPARVLAHQGAFVSLHSGGALRGCVGMFPATRPLAATVIDCAAAAATGDPRFEPLRLPDLGGITIEISALDPPFRVAGPHEIRCGTHGVIVRDGSRRGLLLPQVALQQRWDAPTLIEETCLKAGLRRDAWTRGAIVEAFSAQVFSESGRPSY